MRPMTSRIWANPNLNALIHDWNSTERRTAHDWVLSKMDVALTLMDIQRHYIAHKL